MKTLATVDPGRGLGWAIFRDSRLVASGLFDGTDLVGVTLRLKSLYREHRPSMGVIEIPQVYQQRLQKGDPNDLIGVAVLAGVAVATMAPYCQAELVHPRVWKGQRPKDVDNRWTLSQLDADELAVAGKNHNVLDAIGLGLWQLKRR